MSGTRLETDAEFRTRIPQTLKQGYPVSEYWESFSGKKLDELAGNYGLRREYVEYKKEEQMDDRAYTPDWQHGYYTASYAEVRNAQVWTLPDGVKEVHGAVFDKPLERWRFRRWDYATGDSLDGVEGLINNPAQPVIVERYLGVDTGGTSALCQSLKSCGPAYFRDYVKFVFHDGRLHSMEKL